MSTIRYSKQREAIKDYLKSVTCHPTADTVYLNIQKHFLISVLAQFTEI